MIKNCLTCGKSFKIKPCRMGTAKYCSMKCYLRVGSKNSFWGKKHSSLTREKMKQVWAKRINNGYVAPNRQELYKKCVICGKRYRVIKSTLKERQTCSMKCKRIYCSTHVRGEKGRNWIDGRSYFPYPPAFNKLLKRRILLRDGNECKNCGTTTDLSVHHVDYDKNNCSDNNLITLCLRCNSIANSNRNYWLNRFKNELNYVRNT